MWDGHFRLRVLAGFPAGIKFRPPLCERRIAECLSICTSHTSRTKMSQASAEEVKAARQIVRTNLVKETMMAGRFASSYGLRLAFSTEMPLIIKRAGYQACLMNLEHMAIGMETMKDISVSCMNVG